MDRGGVGCHRKLQARWSVRGPCGLEFAFRFVALGGDGLPQDLGQFDPLRQREFLRGFKQRRIHGDRILVRAVLGNRRSGWQKPQRSWTMPDVG
jgi:hypothetical protein